MKPTLGYRGEVQNANNLRSLVEEIYMADFLRIRVQIEPIELNQFPLEFSGMLEIN